MVHCRFGITFICCCYGLRLNIINTSCMCIFWKTKQAVEKTVDAYTMFDINKTIMRCLVKNLAMFGLALYIYAGEDLPEEAPPEPVDLDALLVPIQQAVDMDTLKRDYIAAVKAAGNNADALKVLESAKDTRKSELMGASNA